MPGRVPDNRLARCNVARDHTPCADNCVVANRHARKYQRSTANPYISADANWASKLQSGLTRCRVARMVGRKNLNTRPNLGLVANADLDNIQDDAVVVQESSSAQGDVESVVAVERRSHTSSVTDGRKALAHQGTTLL